MSYRRREYFRWLYRYAFRWGNLKWPQVGEFEWPPGFGHLLESFVVQQLMAKAGWTDPDLRFWHYRDKDQVEVDLVITRGRETWGAEVKAAATLEPSDGQGLRRLAEQCGRHFRGGMILHAGASILPTADSRVLAVPLSELWTR